MRFPVEAIPQLLAAALLLALIVIVLRAGPRRRVNQALALVFASTLAYDACTFLNSASTASYPWAVTAALQDAFGLTDGILLVGFAVAYVEDAGYVRSAWWTRPSPYVVASALLTVTVILRPALFMDYGPALRYANVADVPASVGFPSGPLSIAAGVIDLAWAVVPFVLAIDALRPSDAARGRSTLLLAAGIGILFAGLSAANGIGLLYGEWEWSIEIALRLATGAILAALVVVLVARAVMSRSVYRAGSARAAGALLAAAALGASAAVVASRGWIVTANAMLFAVFLLSPLVIAYAILRHQLLGIDVKVHWTLVRGIIGGVFLAFFFIVEQVTQNFLSERFGLLLGALAAVGLLFAVAPIRTLAERVADRALPGASPRSDEATRERAYASALRIAMRHPALSAADERSLAHLADVLGITGDAAARLRREVEGELRSSPPPA